MFWARFLPHFDILELCVSHCMYLSRRDEDICWLDRVDNHIHLMWFSLCCRSICLWAILLSYIDILYLRSDCPLFPRSVDSVTYISFFDYRFGASSFRLCLSYRLINDSLWLSSRHLLLSSRIRSCLFALDFIFASEFWHLSFFILSWVHFSVVYHSLKLCTISCYSLIILC